MAMAYPSSAGARAWASYFQEVDAPWPLALAQNVTQQRHKTPEDIRRRHGNKDGKADAQGKVIHKGRDAGQGQHGGEWA